MTPEREIRPPEVARLIGRTERHTRRLMATQKIPSWDENPQGAYRSWVTVPSAVAAYQQRRLLYSETLTPQPPTTAATTRQRLDLSLGKGLHAATLPALPERSLRDITGLFR